MQHMVSRPQGDNNGNSQVQTIIITAITLFALSGLMVGFAVGVFARPKQSASPNVTQHNTIPVIGHTPTSTPTPGSQVVPLGCPSIDKASSLYQNNTQAADGATVYTLSIQARDKSSGKGCDDNNKPVTADGITCRLWLMKQSEDPLKLPDDHLHDINTLNNPLPDNKEITGALAFDPTTPETQPCNKGVGTWKYRIAPSTEKGTYRLMVLTDWNGTYYNWSWGQIEVKNEKG